MTKVNVELFGGEQDGYRASIELRSRIPDVFYIWRAADNDKISRASGKERMVLADKLAVLAYRLDDQTDKQLRYVRHEEADKAIDPAM